MTERKSPQTWWHEMVRSERFNGAEWAMLGVSAMALAGALVVFVRILA